MPNLSSEGIHFNKRINDSLNLFLSGILILLICVPSLILITGMGFEGIFDYRLVVLDIFLFAVIWKSAPAGEIRSLAVKAFFIRHLLLFILLFANYALGQDLFLFLDDFSYHEMAKNAAFFEPFLRENPFEGTTLFESAYYYRFLEITYRIAGPNTLTGRLINIFLAVMIGIISHKITIFHGVIHSLNRMTKYILFFPDLILFSIFEFKDILFTFLCLLIIFLCQKAFAFRNKKMVFRMLFFLSMALLVASFSNWFRVGVGWLFLFTSFITIVIPSKLLFKKTTITPTKVIIFTVFVIICLSTINTLVAEPSLGLMDLFFYKIKFYLHYTQSALQESGGFLRLLAINNPTDFLKTPLIILFAPFTPFNFFAVEKFNLILLGIFRFVSFSIYAGFLFSLFTKKIKIDYYEIIQITVPSLLFLIVLSLTNIGVIRHFVFLAPFLIIMSRHYSNCFNPYFFLTLGSFVYSLFFTYILFKI